MMTEEWEPKPALPRERTEYQPRRCRTKKTSHSPSIADIFFRDRVVPCVDGSLLARVFFTVQLVGSGHVFGLFARFT